MSEKTPTRDDEKFEAWFKEFNTWGLSGKELLQLTFKGENDGDTVYVRTKGEGAEQQTSEMTRFQANNLYNQYLDFKTGWNACWKMQGDRTEDA